MGPEADSWELARVGLHRGGVGGVKAGTSVSVLRARGAGRQQPSRAARKSCPRERVRQAPGYHRTMQRSSQDTSSMEGFERAMCASLPVPAGVVAPSPAATAEAVGPRPRRRRRREWLRRRAHQRYGAEGRSGARAQAGGTRLGGRRRAAVVAPAGRRRRRAVVPRQRLPVAARRRQRQTVCRGTAGSQGRRCDSCITIQDSCLMQLLVHSSHAWYSLATLSRPQAQHQYGCKSACSR